MKRVQIGWQEFDGGRTGGYGRTPKPLVDALVEADGNRTRLLALARTPVLKFAGVRVVWCRLVPSCAAQYRVLAHSRAVWCRPVSARDVPDVCKWFATRQAGAR